MPTNAERLAEMIDAAHEADGLKILITEGASGRAGPTARDGGERCHSDRGSAGDRHFLWRGACAPEPPPRPRLAGCALPSRRGLPGSRGGAAGGTVMKAQGPDGPSGRPFEEALPQALLVVHQELQQARHKARRAPSRVRKQVRRPLRRAGGKLDTPLVSRAAGGPACAGRSARHFRRHRGGVLCSPPACTAGGRGSPPHRGPGPCQASQPCSSWPTSTPRTWRSTRSRGKRVPESHPVHRYPFAAGRSVR